VIGDHRAAQRLLVLGVTASTARLVRGLRDGSDQQQLRVLMTERRRMLQSLEAALPEAAFAEPMQALGAAVAESDRTVEALLA
jgi:hypothetical protein